MTAPAPRQRSSGGGIPLIVLGIVLALATAAMVLVVTSGGGGAQSGVLVVVASRTLPTGTVLSPSGGSPAISIGSAFHTVRMPGDAVPSDAYAFTSESDLAHTLNGLIVTQTFMSGDILRKSDERLSSLGPGPPSSLTELNPNALPSGDVLFALSTSGGMGQIGAKAGDHVDVLATECVNSSNSACQLTQTTLQNLLVYDVPSSGVLILVLSHQDALVLKLLVETAHLDLVLLKPGDTGNVTTQAVNTQWIINHFNFTPPSS